MASRAFRNQAFAAVFGALGVSVAAAQDDGFVAPYVPTVEEDVELMLDVAGVRPDDYVIDLGSGDGRIVIAAARRGALGHGVELDGELVTLARANSREAGVADRATFAEGDIFQTDIALATVVTLYLFPEANLMLRPKLLAELRPGTRVVSNSFHMDDWKPDVHDMSARSSGGILLWIIPAQISGEWLIEIDGETDATMTVQQHYQEIEVGFARSGAGLTVDFAMLRGDRIRFGVTSIEASYAFDGTIEADAIRGYVQIKREAGDSIAAWRAIRR